MKKIRVLILFFSFLLLILFYTSPVSSESQDGITIAGILHLGSIPFTPQFTPQPNETGYWLELDEPVYVLQGSKSEASTNIVLLNVTADLKEKTQKFKEKHVVLAGDLNCTGNWASGAFCNMLVKQINQREK